MRDRKPQKRPKPAPRREPSQRPQPLHPPENPVTPEVHQTVLQALRAVVAEVAALQPDAPSPLRLRDWTLDYEDDGWLCRLYLDRGQSWLGYDDFRDDPRHAHNREVVGMEDCVAVHKRLLASPEIMNLIPMDPSLEVGSAGEAPPLRDLEDFEAAVGLMVAVTTWAQVQTGGPGRAATFGRLSQCVPDAEGSAEIILDIMPERPVSQRAPEVPEGSEPRGRERIRARDIFRASLLLFDPRNFAKS